MAEVKMDASEEVTDLNTSSPRPSDSEVEMDPVEMDPVLSELEEDIKELKLFHDQSQRPRVKELLQNDIKKLEMEASTPPVPDSPVAEAASLPEPSPALPAEKKLPLKIVDTYEKITFADALGLAPPKDLDAKSMSTPSESSAIDQAPSPLSETKVDEDEKLVPTPLKSFVDQATSMSPPHQMSVDHNYSTSSLNPYDQGESTPSPPRSTSTSPTNEKKPKRPRRKRKPPVPYPESELPKRRKTSSKTASVAEVDAYRDKGMFVFHSNSSQASQAKNTQPMKTAPVDLGPDIPLEIRSKIQGKFFTIKVKASTQPEPLNLYVREENRHKLHNHMTSVCEVVSVFMKKKKCTVKKPCFLDFKAFDEFANDGDQKSTGIHSLTIKDELPPELNQLISQHTQLQEGTVSKRGRPEIYPRKMPGVHLQHQPATPIPSATPTLTPNIRPQLLPYLSASASGTPTSTQTVRAQLLQKLSASASATPTSIQNIPVVQLQNLPASASVTPRPTQNIPVVQLQNLPASASVKPKSTQNIPVVQLQNLSSPQAPNLAQNLVLLPGSNQPFFLMPAQIQDSSQQKPNRNVPIKDSSQQNRNVPIIPKGPLPVRVEDEQKKAENKQKGKVIEKIQELVGAEKFPARDDKTKIVEKMNELLMQVNSLKASLTGAGIAPGSSDDTAGGEISEVDDETTASREHVPDLTLVKQEADTSSLNLKLKTSEDLHKRFYWTRAHTLKLLELYKEYKPTLDCRPQATQPVWGVLAKRLNELPMFEGADQSPHQLKKKMKLMKLKCQKEWKLREEKLAKGETLGVPSKYYAIMCSILDLKVTEADMQADLVAEIEKAEAEVVRMTAANLWTSIEEAKLIQLVTKYQKNLAKMKNKVPMWEIMRDELNKECGSNRTVSNCRDKLHFMRQKFFKEKRAREKCEDDGVTPKPPSMFYDALYGMICVKAEEIELPDELGEGTSQSSSDVSTLPALPAEILEPLQQENMPSGKKAKFQTIQKVHSLMAHSDDMLNKTLKQLQSENKKMLEKLIEKL